MKKLVTPHEWKIIQEGFDPENNEIFESLMSLGNGYMGMRGNHEEPYGGKTLKGTYYAGVYYPDKTKVGWWKNGYPESFAKVLNGIDFIGIEVIIDGIPLDLNTWSIVSYKRTLNMKFGLLTRDCEIRANNGETFTLHSERFLSIADRETGAIRYSITSNDGNAHIVIKSFLNGAVSNRDSNYEESFWEPIDAFAATENEFGLVAMETKKTGFKVAVSMKNDCFVEGNKVYPTEAGQDDAYASIQYETELQAEQTLTLYKFIGAATNRDHESDEVILKSEENLLRSFSQGYDGLKTAHEAAWDLKWSHNDIVIEGDPSAQQGIRFNIFQLNQTYTGEDDRLNIGPKGFTGEKYGGSTYWDTEAYCLNFYLGTAPSHIARNLLVYRHKHLEKAKENAAKLGMKGALYPMVTMNGEECHNEWEITFEEIHRNGAMAYAIYNYVNYTGDQHYLAEYGFDVLGETARYWADRVNYVESKDCYMILGVTGPNEYENNVNNNWYTNTLAAWHLKYAYDSAEWLKNTYPARWTEMKALLYLTDDEIAEWLNISEKMYYPYDENLGIFLQQDGYLDKEQRLVKDLAPEEVPLNQKWSWDRILRSCFIKQADVLQGFYFFEDRYDSKTLQKHFDFYEPRTVHESSLSPCVHSILASKLGLIDKAYSMYLRTARLDLDDYNNDTEDGLHITSMAGTWMSLVQGFGGLRVKEGQLCFSPVLPKAWQSITFRIMFRGRTLELAVSHKGAECNRIEGLPLVIRMHEKEMEV